MFSMTPNGDPSQIAMSESSFVQICSGETATFADTDSVPENYIPWVSVPTLAILTPVPGEPGHFTGSGTILHHEEPKPGGMLVIDQTVEWDLMRTVER
jgi:hypothetical protein